MYTGHGNALYILRNYFNYNQPNSSSNCQPNSRKNNIRDQANNALNPAVYLFGCESVAFDCIPFCHPNPCLDLIGTNSIGDCKSNRKIIGCLWASTSTFLNSVQCNIITKVQKGLTSE